MADYGNDGNRWTAIFLRKPQPDGHDLYALLPFELCRFNVDVDPKSPLMVVPVGPDHSTENKLYEKIWVVDAVPFSLGGGKTGG